MPSEHHLIKAQIHRLVTSRYPPIDIFENTESPEDAQAALLLETLTSGRINPMLERLNKLPREEQRVGMGSGYIMAAFLYGEAGRFNGDNIGAWYASFNLDTAMRETIYHHTRRLKKEENGLLGTTIRMRQLLANVNHPFYDITDTKKTEVKLYDLSDYDHSQRFADKLRQENEGGIYYRSVRHKEGKNLVVFKPSLIKNVKQSGHFEYEWHGEEEPSVMELCLLNAIT